MKNFFVCLSCLFFLLSVLSSSIVHPRRLLLRVRCFNHSSHRIKTGEMCADATGRCDPKFKFCLKDTTSVSASCIGGEKVLSFTNSDLLGACAPKAHPNFPDPIALANLSTSTWESSTLFLQVHILHSHRKGIVQTTQLIDGLTFNLTGRKFPESPFGEPVTSRAISLLPISSESAGAPSAPLFRLESALECPPYRYGSGCSQKCVTTATQICYVNGSSSCRGECEQTTDANRKSTEVSSTPTLMSTTMNAATTTDVILKRKKILTEPIMAVIGTLCVIIVGLIVFVVVLFICRRRVKKVNLPIVRYTAAPTRDLPLPRTIGDLATQRKPGDCEEKLQLRVNLSPYDEEPAYESLYEQMGSVYSDADDYECHATTSVGPTCTTPFIRR